MVEAARCYEDGMPGVKKDKVKWLIQIYNQLLSFDCMAGLLYKP